MNKAILRQREIIDRKALYSHLAGVAEWSGITARNRADVLAVFKQALNDGGREIRRRFEQHNVKGLETIKAQSFLLDQLIRVLYDLTVTYVYPVANPTTGERVSIVATGGYGRGELAPFSDIDLMFLLDYKRTPRTEQVIEYILYMLWDMGLTVGHATRSVDEAVKLSRSDLTIRTSLLEARWLWGDEMLFARFKKKFAADIAAANAADFVDAKLAERDQRHDKLGDTRYVLEPNVKEGKGGLRDLQTLYWIAKYLYRVENVQQLVDKEALTKRDAKHFAKAENFLWTVRCHLHYLSGRPEERLAFNVQDELARRMSYTDRAGARGVERFMKHYYLVAKEVGNLTRIMCAVLEAEQKKRRFRMPRFLFRKTDFGGFVLDGQRLTVGGDGEFKNAPIKLLKLFAEAQRNELDIHPRALRLITQSLRLIGAELRQDEQANRLFMQILTSKKDPETSLKRLNEAGVLGRFLPDFGRVVAQMQYDMYHVYTVDEHTIRAIGFLSRIEKGRLREDHPVASSVIGEVQSRDALYVAVLLHDIAKGRGGDHSELGAEVALRICPRFGLSDWETQTVCWLVRYHLLMSNTAFKREIEDPKTISDFVAIVQSPERLRLLLILTVVDIRAVGPNVWNGWKASLLRELYYRAQEVIAGGEPRGRHVERVENAKAALARVLKDWNQQDIGQHLARGYDDYWLGYDVYTHERHAALIKKAIDQGLDTLIECRVDRESDATEVIVYTHGHPGVFARIAGAMSLSGATIVDARIATMANGMALDSFWIQNADSGPFKDAKGLHRLRERIESALEGRLQPSSELKKVRSSALSSRMSVFTVPPRVLIDNSASAKFTVIEVNGRDRLGFLSDVTTAITRSGLQIASAHISTYGERVVDVFYVKDIFGLKVEHEGKLKQVRAALLTAIAPPQNELEGDRERSSGAAA